MSKFINYVPNYDRFPAVKVPFDAVCDEGWEQVIQRLQQQIGHLPGAKKVIAVECYPGVIDEPYITHLSRVGQVFHAADCMLPEDAINRMVYPDVTDDEIFGYLTRLNVNNFLDNGKVEACRETIRKHPETAVIYGIGASLVCPEADLLVYVDMARWEIQMRFRRNEVGNIGTDNRNEKASLKYKRAFFVDWRICDRLKKTILPRCDFVIDANQPDHPRMVTGNNLRRALAYTVQRPFRVVPFFDPGPWGGQWMKEVCDLDRSAINYAWCFDCVPEENSLLLDFGGIRFETPSINLVFMHPRELLGNPVHGRFGDEFPIRFDFLDTMDGGNLSLQVHPLTEYIQEKFGMHYTQDESYYILDAEDDAVVYLGLRDDINPAAMCSELREAQTTGVFDAEKHVGKYPVKKHDHVLIPGGTVHCSGKNSMVLEISATPFIFTFKLWDWGRLGLDGKPRPINIAHGEKNIQWDRRESWVRSEALDRVVKIGEGEGWTEERTGLHEREFIETRRHWFTQTVEHYTANSVNVLNLVEGREVMVESPAGAFEPFVVHYAETFIVPAAAGSYTIRPYGESEGKQCATIKAYVRHHA